MTENEIFLKGIVADLHLVATYVATQPSGYAGFQAECARLLLHTVDVRALEDTVHSVLFTSSFLRQFGPLTKVETRVEQAALRLRDVQRSIRIQQSEIQSRMAA